MFPFIFRSEWLGAEPMPDWPDVLLRLLILVGNLLLWAFIVFLVMSAVH